MSRLGPVFLLLLALLWPAPLPAQAPESPPPQEDALRKLAEAFTYQKGHIVLQNGLASLNVPDNFRYLGPQDAETLLTKIWGNLPGGAGLGMLMPSEVSPLDEASWGIIISYSEDGFVKDDEASKIDYGQLLQDMQKATREANGERVKEGYPAVDLIGWAKPPRYDQPSHKLYWAKELKVDGASEHTLNYNIRLLGRRGVLMLNAIASVQQLPQIEAAIPAILQMVDFQEGHRYTDFNPSTDKVATYGIAALVTGGILAKAGFFKLLFAGILAAKKFIIIGAVALYGFLKKLLGGSKEKSIRDS